MARMTRHPARQRSAGDRAPTAGRRRPARRSALAALGVAALAAGSVAGTFGAGSANASSHREAPNISGSPRLDTTDVYAFLSPDKSGTATLIANWIPFEEPAGGPNFYTFADGAHYDINVDTDGDAKADIVYRWEFDTKTRNSGTFLYNTGPVTSLDDPDLNIRQTYTVSRWADGKWTQVASNLVAAPSYVGKASMPDYASLRQEATYSKWNYHLFAGQADDPFFLDLRVFNLLYGANLSEVGNDTLRGYNVNSVAIQVPVAELGGAKNVVGVWSTTSVKGADGDYRQVSRLGNPLVNEVVIPLKDKDKFNASKPKDDAQFLNYVTKPGLPKVLNAVYGLPVPAEPRNDLVSVFLTGVKGVNQPAKVTPSEQLRLNLTPFANQTPSRLGVVGGDLNGFPNGRRLTDDVVDESLQVVAGQLVGMPNSLGDGVNANDVAFGASFPYLALPNSGSSSVNVTGARSAGTAQSGLVSPLQGGKPNAGTASAALTTSATANGSAASANNAATAGSTSGWLDTSSTTATLRTASLPVTAALVGGLGVVLLARRRMGNQPTA